MPCIAFRVGSPQIDSDACSLRKFFFYAYFASLGLFHVHIVSIFAAYHPQGVFLFMGLVSLGSNTLWQRFLMFFMQPSKYPLEPYTLHMRPRRMHLFTSIQLGLFAFLYTVKAIKTIAIAFPLVIACCIPIRLYLLPKIFTEKELVMVDSDDAAIKKWLAAHHDDDDDCFDDEDVIRTKEDHDEKGERDDKGTKLSHHVGEDNEFFVKDIIEGPVDKDKDTIDIENGGEELDQWHPLPPEEETRNREPRRRRRNRKKSLSCPTTHLLFSETPHGFVKPEIALTDHVVLGSANSTVTQSEEGDIVNGEGGIQVEQTAAVIPRPRHTRRAKSLSCPTHLLYAEADRHVAENYFFG